MNELITVTYENDRPVVSARDLHKMLEVGTKFQDWFPRMCEYGFTEGVDFNPIKIENVHSQKRERTYSTTDYQLTIDMAKEVSMLQRTEKGKQVRQYFIQIEKDWNSPEKVMARALQIANQQIEELKSNNFALLAENEQQRDKIEQDRPLVEFAEHVSQSVDNIDMATFAKLLHDENIKIGRNRLFAWMKKNKYLMQSTKPYQKYVDAGYFDLVERPFETPYGKKHVYTQTLVTGKGQIYFTERLRKEFGKQ